MCLATAMGFTGSRSQLFYFSIHLMQYKISHIYVLKKRAKAHFFYTRRSWWYEVRTYFMTNYDPILATNLINIEN